MFEAHIHDVEICGSKLHFRERIERIPFLGCGVSILINPPFLALIYVAGKWNVHQSNGLCSKVEGSLAMDQGKRMGRTVSAEANCLMC